MIILNEGFMHGDFSNYLGKDTMIGIKNYLSKFKEYNENDKTLLTFQNDKDALEVSKQIILDAQAGLSQDKTSPAINYIMYRCAPSIIEGYKKFFALRRATTVNLDVTGTNEFQGYVDAVYEFITRKEGMIAKTDLNKFDHGDILNMVNYILGLNLGNLHKELLTKEHYNGVNYEGTRSKSMVKYDASTGKYYDRATGKELTAQQAKDLQSRANIRKRGISLDAPIKGADGEEYDNSGDAIIARYGLGPGVGLANPEKDFFSRFENSDLLENWKKCCMDTEWTKKNNIKASILKTLIKDMVNDNIDQKTFIEKCKLNKQTFRNYMGLTPEEIYPGVTVKMILEDYEVDIPNIVKYCKNNPGKMNYLLDMLPGGMLHEALKRYMNKKRLIESLVDDILNEFELTRLDS